MKTEIELAGADPKKTAIFGVLAYTTDAPDGDEISFHFTGAAKEMLATLSDFELKIFAMEASLILRQRLEMPPSPKRSAP